MLLGVWIATLQTGMVFILFRGSWSICRRSALRCSGQLHELGFEASPSGSGTRAGGVLFVLGAEWCAMATGPCWFELAVGGGRVRHVPAVSSVLLGLSLHVLGVKAGHLSDPS